MTKASEMIGDPNARLILDHGFVRLVDHMGSDGAVVQAARTSYGDGTKSVSADTALIRYLMRHQHTSPFEMCQVKLHIKIPIFVMRQLVRHRTASLNEYSGRYSVMTDEFYVPEDHMVKPQSQTNNQGRAGELSETNVAGAKWFIQTANEMSYDIYKALLGPTEDTDKRDVVFDPYDPNDPMFDPDFNGIARELARTVLPVSNYTELYWCQNLRNLFHLIKLRWDKHAQEEIRILANAIYDLVLPLFPASVKAFDDYVRLGVSLSRMEKEIFERIIASTESAKTVFSRWLVEAGSDKVFAEKNDLSVRELKEFVTEWKLPLYDEAVEHLATLA
jgi:thymidylate synthase (FAD)